MRIKEMYEEDVSVHCPHCGAKNRTNIRKGSSGFYLMCFECAWTKRYYGEVEFPWCPDCGELLWYNSNTEAGECVWCL